MISGFNPLPTFMTFDNANMELSVTTDGTLGNNYLFLKGTYDSGKFDYASILIEGISTAVDNFNAPKFESGLKN